MKRTVGYISFAAALGLLAIFEYALYNLFSTGTCASGTTAYVIARPCPQGTGAFMIALPISLVLAGLCSSAVTSILGIRAAALIWSALFVTTGMQFFNAAHGSSVGGVVFYGLSAMFVVMGLAPFFMSTQALEASE